MKALEDLLALMATLRDPERGCPWDRAQDFASIAPYTIEEAYEVAEAIERGTPADLRDELGDLLFQVVFHARMAEEAGHFDFADVAQAIHDKMRRRHPHVFADADAADPEVCWEAIKERERRMQGAASDHSALAGVPVALPGLSRATKMTRRAARTGFDWRSPAGPLAKIQEELDELQEARGDGDPERIEAEMGDVLFACANLSRHLGVDPERALRGTIQRFEGRFRAMEHELGEAGADLAEADDATRERAWERAKQQYHEGES